MGNSEDYKEINKFKNMKFFEQNKIYVEKKFRKLSITTLICEMAGLIAVCLLIELDNHAINSLDIIILSIITYTTINSFLDILKSNSNINLSQLHIDILEYNIKDLEETFAKIDSNNKE